MFISACLSHLIHSSGAIHQNQAQWVIFKCYPRGDLGIVNVYAPYLVHDQINLWQSLEAALSSSIRWILTNDWNMVLSSQDNSNFANKIVVGPE
jgi:hypothetical protein